MNLYCSSASPVGDFKVFFQQYARFNFLRP
jgi:hypothetical protein